MNQLPAAIHSPVRSRDPEFQTGVVRGQPRHVAFPRVPASFSHSRLGALAASFPAEFIRSVRASVLSALIGLPSLISWPAGEGEGEGEGRNCWLANAQSTASRKAQAVIQDSGWEWDAMMPA